MNKAPQKEKAGNHDESELGRGSAFCHLVWFVESKRKLNNLNDIKQKLYIME